MLPFPLAEIILSLGMRFTMAIGETVNSRPFAVFPLPGITADDHNPVRHWIGQLIQRFMVEDFRSVGSGGKTFGFAQIRERRVQIRWVKI